MLMDPALYFAMDVFRTDNSGCAPSPLKSVVPLMPRAATPAYAAECLSNTCRLLRPATWSRHPVDGRRRLENSVNISKAADRIVYE